MQRKVQVPRRQWVVVAGLMLVSGCATMQPHGSASIDRIPLDSNATRFNATPSGLRYHILRRGKKNGDVPVDGDSVSLDYEGKLLNGTKFDSSFDRGQPLNGTVGQFVPGFNEALKLMRPGDDWIIWLPPELGYGASAAGPIPANSTLRFRMALHSVSRATQ